MYMLQLLLGCSGQPLIEPTVVEQQGPPEAAASDGSSAIQRLNDVLQQSPEAAAIMRKAASDVASRPYARQAVTTLLKLMQTTQGTNVVMSSLQELMGGASDGPGLRSLAQALGLDGTQFSQAAQAMQAVPPYGSDASLPLQGDDAAQAVMNSLQGGGSRAAAPLAAAPGWGADAATLPSGGAGDVINSQPGL